MATFSTEHLTVFRAEKCYCGTTNIIIPGNGLTRKNIGSGEPSFGYIIEGSGKYIRDDGTVYEFKAGTIFLKQPDREFDQIHAPGIFINKYFVLDQLFYEYIMDQLTPADTSIHINGRVCPDALRRFDLLINEIRFQKETLLAVSWAKVLAFVMELCIPEKELAYPYQPEMEHAVHMLENVEKPYAIPTIAKELGMSEPNFRRIFKKVFGIPPIEYKVRHRLKIIRQKLENREKSVKALAHEFGYSDAYALSAQLKKYYGYSPRNLIQ